MHPFKFQTLCLLSLTALTRTRGELVAFWDFEDPSPFNDKANSNHLSVLAGSNPVQSSDVKEGAKAVSFSGSSCLTTNTLTHSFANDEFSLCYWMKHDPNVWSSGMFGIGCSTCGLGAIMGTRTAPSDIRTSGAWGSVAGNIVPSATVWKHVCVVVVDNAFKFYQDGSLRKTVNGITGVAVVNGKFTIGCTRGNNMGAVAYYTSSSKIDDVYLYNHAISAAQVAVIVSGVTVINTLSDVASWPTASAPLVTACVSGDTTACTAGLGSEDCNSVVSGCTMNGYACPLILVCALNHRDVVTEMIDNHDCSIFASSAYADLHTMVTANAPNLDHVMEILV